MTDDYLLDDLERSQLNATRRRRSKRSRRYYQLLLLSLGFLALIVLAGPSLISHSGIARSLLASNAQAYGWKASAESINVGWITPLTIKNLELVGGSGETLIRIDRADTALTVTDLIGFDPATIGEVSVRGVKLVGTVAEGHSSIESDLAQLLEPSDDDTVSTVLAAIQIQDAGATLTDSVTGESWELNQSNVNVAIDGQKITGDVAGVVNEPNGSGGAIQSHFVWHPASGLATDHLDAAVQPVSRTDSEKRWELLIDTESFPLSVTNLISRRFGGQIGGLPEQLSGDTTGHIELVGASGGSIQASLGDLQIRNLQAVAGPTAGAPSPDGLPRSAPPTQWNNELATLDGQFTLSGEWMHGRGLEITTDFASATLDGSFPTTISLVGTDDNPIRWLQALDGTARVDVDLAALDQALPGLIPLRRDATIVSGRAHGIIENTPSSDQTSDASATRRSKLTLTSESLRARSDGQMVMIEPIELTATVTEDNGSLRAERFDLNSSFAEASGSGTLRDGTAEVQIDFGRLYTMLRPIIELSDLSLGGTAGGKVHWTVNRDGHDGADQWDLGGSGEAKNLLVTLPNGHRFKRAIVQGDVSAKGQWNGRTLEQLTAADVAVRSGGVSLHAELTSPVKKPTPDSMYPIRLRTDGRLENLSESLRPWLPEALRSAEGRLSGSAMARVSRSGGSLSKADFIVSQPRINYASRWYTQRSLGIKFDGTYDWPSGHFASQEMTLVGEAISLAVRGEATRGKTNLDVAWKADLKGLQASVGSTIARAASTKLVRPISYRAVRNNSYHVSGQCDGKLNITGGPADWKIDSSTSATDLSIYRPSGQGIVPPGTITSSSRATFGQSFGRQHNADLGETLWHEPRLKVDGTVEYNQNTGAVLLPGMQVASDWFAGTLAGEVQTLGEQVTANVFGPTRWKMDVVAERLSQLLGTPIRTSGIHEGPIEISFATAATQPMTLVVKGDLGWDRCEVGGILLGNANMPYVLTERTIKVAHTTIPILSLEAQSSGAPTDAGLASFAAEVDYASSPSTIRLEPGSKIQTLRITPSTSAGWLKYLTPLAAGAASVDGTVAAEFDEALIVMDDPDASVVRGSLDVQTLRLASGPLATELIQGVEQIKSLARLTGGEVEPKNAKTWIEMPPQSVEFSFENGIATHQRMFFKIDRANLMTSGSVTTDSRINLVAHVPLDARWLGNDLKGLAGQTLTFPITGTLTRPTLDDSAVRSVMAELGTKAGAEVIQNRLDGVIQKQLGSGMEQINSGLEKIFQF